MDSGWIVAGLLALVVLAGAFAFWKFMWDVTFRG